MIILFNNRENAMRYLSGDDLGRIIHEDMVKSIINKYPIQEETTLIDVLYLQGENTHIPPITSFSDLNLDEFSTSEIGAFRVTVLEGELDVVLNELEEFFVGLEKFEWCKIIKDEKDKYEVLAIN